MTHQTKHKATCNYRTCRLALVLWYGNLV